MDKSAQINNRERLKFLNLIAEQEARHEQEIAEKDREIAYWQARYEMVQKHRMHERHERTVMRQDRLTGAIFAICCSGAFWFMLAGLKEFLLWASGQ